MNLAARLARQIALAGPLSMADFMAAALADKDYGYYLRQKPFGREGDFITAPEISQLFGELIGIWVILSWQALGEPARFMLAEGGPGRGTLADDILRVLAKLAPACFAAAELHLLEISPALRRCQAAKLAAHNKPISWAANINELAPAAEADAAKAGPLIFIANELLDALPIHQYHKTAEGWREKLLAADNKGNLHFTLGLPQPLPGFCPDAEFVRLCAAAAPGAIAETSPARAAFTAALCALLKTQGGAALLIDYGALEHGLGDTIQAVAGHKYAPLLENIGGSDISSHVNFAAHAAMAAGAGLKAAALTQGEFLLRLGLLERAGRLGAGKSAAAQAQIKQDVARLAGGGPQGMGDLFKTLCITAEATEMPPFGW